MSFLIEVFDVMWDETWLKQYPLLCFKSGQTIISLGEIFSHYYCLRAGICARIHPTYDGDEVIMQYLHPGDMIGMGLKNFGEESVSEFVARKDCECYQIPFEDVEQLLQTDATLCYAVYQNTLLELDFWATSYLAKTLGGGISILCLALHTQAKEQRDGTYLVDSMFTNMELSKYCGVHPVSISRFMTQLHHEGILERKKDGIHIYDRERLYDYVKLGK